MPARQDSRAFSDTSYVGGCSSCALPTFCSKGSGMRVYWKWVIKSVPILGLTLLMLATTVTPRQAHSNVEAWFNYFGIEDVPLWVATKSIDAWIFWIAFVGVGLWSTQLYVRSNIVKGKLSVVIREGEPWVHQGKDQSQSAHTSGLLYTYRVALVNS